MRGRLTRPIVGPARAALPTPHRARAPAPWPGAFASIAAPVAAERGARALSELWPGAPITIAATPVVTDRTVPAQRNVSAATVDGVVHVDPRAFSTPAHERARLAAHEAAHVLQFRDGRRTAAAPALEEEARDVARELTKGRAVQPQLKPSAGMPLFDTPHDRWVVERARARLQLLERYMAEWQVRSVRQTRYDRERRDWRTRRRALDATMVDPSPPGMRERVEEANIERLNRRPLTISVAEQEVRIAVRFHVRFEDASHAARYNELVESVRAGIQLVWNQRMPSSILDGRRFEIAPSFTRVGSGAARNLDYWLITVRPNDNDVATYERCTLDATQQGVPTSVTDPMCDGGVMSIPPGHISRAGVLGHETMHLFGLVDRYMNLVSRLPGGRTVSVNDPLRETGGRPDPLGTQDARVLAEDLGFLLDRLGVYEMEAERGLETLRRLERSGLTVGAVTAEIHRLREIIRLGRDPRSLLPIRRDFNDRMLRDAENL